jgi:hypothetical protein
MDAEIYAMDGKLEQPKLSKLFENNPMPIKPYRLVTLFMLLALIIGCTLTPAISLEQCRSICLTQGRSIKKYQVGSVVPIFKPAPPVVCECG